MEGEVDGHVYMDAQPMVELASEPPNGFNWRKTRSLDEQNAYYAEIRFVEFEIAYRRMSKDMQIPHKVWRRGLRKIFFVYVFLSSIGNCDAHSGVRKEVSF